MTMYDYPEENLQNGARDNKKKFDLSRAKGLLLMVLSATMTASMNNIIKYTRTTTEIPVMQAIVIRSFYLGLGTYISLKKDKVNILSIPGGTFKYIMLRCLTGVLSVFCMYLAIDVLPLSLAVTLYYTSPIFTAVVCYLFLGEKLSKLEIISIFSSLFGMILLTKPQLIFPFMSE